MVDRRKKDVNWAVAEADGSMPNWERVNAALLMDIRDELKGIRVQLNSLNHKIVVETPTGKWEWDEKLRSGVWTSRLHDWSPK